MRVVYLAAGAAGMLCGSCLRDNRLVLTLRQQGRDILLIPLYTPIRTDEADSSENGVLFGGINVYLQSRGGIFARLPSALRRWLDSRAVLGSVGRFATTIRPEAAGELTLAVLRADHGPLRGELDRLVEGLKRLAPRVINLPDLMFIGIAARLRAELGAAVVCTLGGEDLFLNGLRADFRDRALDLIRAHANDVDAFIAVTRYYGDYCASHFGINRARIRHVPLGIHVADALPPRVADERRDTEFRIGYVARIAPEKGLANLVDALIALRNEGRECRVIAAGWLGKSDRGYLAEINRRAAHAGLASEFEYRGEVSREQKFALLAECDAFSVPTVYHEAKGLYVLESLAAGVPVVLPDHGAFPELIDSTGGGILYDPAHARGLANALVSFIDDPRRRRSLAEAGRAAVVSRHTDEQMAINTWRIYEEFAAARIAAP